MLAEFLYFQELLLCVRDEAKFFSPPIDLNRTSMSARQ